MFGGQKPGPADAEIYGVRVGDCRERGRPGGTVGFDATSFMSKARTLEGAVTLYPFTHRPVFRVTAPEFTNQMLPQAGPLTLLHTLRFRGWGKRVKTPAERSLHAYGRSPPVAVVGP